MKSLHEMLARIAKMQEKAKAREKIDQDKSEGDSEAVVSDVAHLPLWSEDMRRLPNEIMRSALFNAGNKKKPRVYFETVDIAVLFEGRISYRGQELRQDDETVWLQLIHLAKEKALGEIVEFTPYSFCKAIGWPIGNRSYERLRDCLSRMQATALAVYSKRLGGGVSLSMIPVFRWQDDKKTTLKKYQVQIAKELVQLFGDVHYTQFEWAQRLALPVGIATWLHGYYASHKEPYPVKIETLAKGAGILTEKNFKIRQLIKSGLNNLVNVGFLKSWEIIGDLVHVKR